MRCFFRFILLSAFWLSVPVSAHMFLAEVNTPQEIAVIREESSAGDDFIPEELTEPHEMNYWQEFFRIMLILGIILGVALLAVRIVKKFIASRTDQINRRHPIQILERRPLSPKSMLYLIEIYGQKILISDSVNGVNKVTECEISLHEREEPEEEDSPGPSFGQILQKKISDKLLKRLSGP